MKQNLIIIFQKSNKWQNDGGKMIRNTENIKMVK